MTEASGILKDLEAIPNPSRKFREWVEEIHILNHEKLGLILQAVIEAGEAHSATQALLYLNDFCRKYSFDGLKVTSVDLRLRRRRKNWFGELENQFQQKERLVSPNSARVHGIIGHVAVPKLLAGGLPEKNSEPCQLEIFPRDSRNTIQQVSRDLRKIQKYWDELRSSPLNSEWFRWQQKTIIRFYDALEKIFGRYARRIRKNDFFVDEYLVFLTCMSWAAASVYARRIGKQILFCEIPVLANAQGINGGRIDAIQIASDVNLTQRELERFAKKSGEQYFRSVGRFLMWLESIAVGDPRVLIKDWKFVVGDGMGTAQDRYIIESKNVCEAPLADHASQMERYLALASLDYMLLKPRREMPKVEMEGEIVYFLPDRMPISHKIKLDPSRVEKFIREIATRWGEARSRARFREVTHLLVNHAAYLMKGQDTGHTSRRLINQGLLFPGDKLKHPLSDIVEEYLKVRI